MKLVPIDSALNSASGYLIHFFQKCRRGTKKSSQTWKSYSLKTGKCRNQIFFNMKLTRNRVGEIGYFKFWFWPFDLWPRPVFWELHFWEIEPWFWHIWITQWLKYFRTTAYFFRFRPSSGGNGRSKLDQKCKLSVRPFSIKTRIIQKIFKQCFCLLEYYIWWEFQQNWAIFWGVRAQKLPQKGYFMDAELVRKTFIITAIPMELTTIMHLYESVNQKPFRARDS